MKDLAIGDWLSALADRTPTPGGGAAAAMSAATSAALIGMVTNYTTGARYADREARMAELNAESAYLAADAIGLAAADEEAFGAVGAAYQLPKDSDEEKATRREAIQRALVGAAVPPARTGRLALRLVEIAAELVESGNPNVISDVAVAASLARAALEAAVVNVEINRSQIRDAVVVAELTAVVAELTVGARAAGEVTSRVQEKINK